MASFGEILGAVLGVAIGGALGVGYAMERDEAMAAVERLDWDAAETHFRNMAPVAEMFEQRGINPGL